MATKLAVDLDGVCYEFERTARYMLREYRSETHLTQESTEWDSILKWLNDKSNWNWLWTTGVRKGLFRYGHMTTGARKALEALRDEGHKIIVVTHRPQRSLNDTLDWLSLYFKDIPLEGFHLVDGNKSQIEADLLIDDKPENCFDWNDAGREAILFNRPWNQNFVECVPECPHSYPHTYRANSWDHVVRLVKELRA